MNQYTHWSPCALKHVLLALGQQWVANGDHEPIGSWRSFRAWLGLDVPGQTQGPEHGDAAHKFMGRTDVVEEDEHGICLGSDGIRNRTAMTGRHQRSTNALPSALRRHWKRHRHTLIQPHPHQQLHNSQADHPEQAAHQQRHG